MYGGNSGCSGMVIYNTDIDGDNAVYGYYVNEEMRFEIGTKDEMYDRRKVREEEYRTHFGTIKIMLSAFFAAVLIVVECFVFLDLRIAFAVMVTCILGYIPLMIILVANVRLYLNEDDMQSFRRFHGCEHAIISTLTDRKPCEMEVLKAGRIYDTECGTAYSGYALILAVEIGLLIVFWPGFLKSAGILLATIVVLIVMILNPPINPFTLIQHPVVMQPGEREYALGFEIMKKVEELK